MRTTTLVVRYFVDTERDSLPYSKMCTTYVAVLMGNGEIYGILSIALSC